MPEEPTKPKDQWDKLDAASGLLAFLSSLAIAAVGGVFTLVYKATEDRRAELEISEKMLSHLVKGDRETEASLALMSSLSRCEVATQMAALFGNIDTIESMKRLATTTTDTQCRNAALKTLDKLSSQGTAVEARAALAAKAAAQTAISQPVAPTIQEFLVQSGPQAQRTDEGIQRLVRRLCRCPAWVQTHKE